MRQGNLQISRGPVAERRSARTVNVRTGTGHHEEEDDSLIITVLQRRWKLLGLSTLLSVAIGAYAYSTNKIPKSVTTGQLIHKPLPPSEHASSMKHTPLTIKELIRSNETLSNLREKHGIEGVTTVKQLREDFVIEANRFSNILDIELTWTDGQKGIDMVNDVMSMVSTTVMEDRRDILRKWRAHDEKAISEIDLNIEQERERIANLKESMERVLQQNGSLATNQQMLAARITALETELRAKTREYNALTTQIKTLSEEERAIDRQLRQELVDEKRIQLAARKKILASATPRLIQLEQTLDSFVDENQKLSYTIFKVKLEQAVENLLPQSAPSTSLSLLERDHAAKIAQIEKLKLTEITLPNQIDDIFTEQEKARRELAKFSGTENFSSVHLEEAEMQLEGMRENRGRLARKCDEYRRLEESKFEELTVLTKASWRTTEEYDGRKKVFALAFASSMIVFALPVFALEHFFPSGEASEHLSKSVGVPVVGKGSFVTEYLRHDKIKRHPINTESLRLLALRIQQSVQGPGAMVLFSGLNHELTSIPTITFLAECLSRREERVLIIDACDKVPHRKGKSDSMKLATEMKALENTSEKDDIDSNSKESKSNKRGKNTALVKNDPQMPLGLSDFFDRSEVETKDIICSTEIPGVDIIPSGNGQFPGEAFGSRRLMGLLDDCRQDYTLILISGPSTNHPSDLQMLSARADGILFTAPKTAKKKGRGEEIVNELIDLGAPVIGIVG